MKFTETPLEGAMIIDLEKHVDHRGYFARAWCKEEFEEHGLNNSMVQCNLSKSFKKGTLRGMHYQIEPHQEDKLIRCIEGTIYDVIIDLRKDSESYLNWFGIELSKENSRMLYAPKGTAHGFQTLEDNSTVFYMVTEFYNPQAERGLRWDDPAFGIDWPLEVAEISERDTKHPDFDE
jgi:dTDP-4-dehydrorhamnose 3,5-epimerase